MLGGIEISVNMKIFAVVAALITVIDQAAKLIVASRLALYEVIEVIPGFFNLVYYRNTGAAFGILNKGGILGKFVLTGISAAAIVVIASLVRSSKDRLYSFGLSLIAGGAAGNLIDRAIYGSVIDFLEFYIGSYTWPAFNVADSAITVGVGLAILSYFVSSKS